MIFYNFEKKESIYFNGFDFCFSRNQEIKTEEFIEFDYSLLTQGKSIVIESIHGDYDIFFIKLQSGDIIQLYFMMDSLESTQKLEIYQPNSKNYSQALVRYESNNAWELNECLPPGTNK